MSIVGQRENVAMTTPLLSGYAIKYWYFVHIGLLNEGTARSCITSIRV